MRTLDKTRVYGSIYPNGGFEQDGLTFDMKGNEVPGQENVPRRPPVVPGAVKTTSDDAVAMVLSDPAALEKLKAQLQSQAVKPAETVETPAAGSSDGGETAAPIGAGKKKG